MHSAITATATAIDQFGFEYGYVGLRRWGSLPQGHLSPSKFSAKESLYNRLLTGYDVDTDICVWDVHING